MIEWYAWDYFKALGHKPQKLYWNKRCGTLMRDAQILGAHGTDPLWKEDILITSVEMRIALMGSNLEEFKMELEETTKQTREARQFLEESMNSMNKITEMLFPLMKSQIDALRSTRMTLQTESRETLKALEDVRRFFLDSTYEVEMSRLDRFLGLCREFQRLKAEGVLDDIADVSIRMALREAKNG